MYIEDGTYKYVIGNFNNYDECAKYNRKMVQMGFMEAFVVKVENGKLLGIPNNGK
jgi:Fe2+ transport system protein FeoA